jgi:DNA-binding MarR family transcriptional regulator
VEPDHVDAILDQWAQERPDLDASPMGLIGRLHRLGDVLDAELRRVFAERGLGNGDFDVLASLRRSGAPYELTAGELSSTTMVTSSAVTKRVDRLERAGLVDRSVCADDARARRIRLTERGFELMEELIEQHVANEQRLVAGLTPQEQAQLAGLLRRWGQQLDG